MQMRLKDKVVISQVALSDIGLTDYAKKNGIVVTSGRKEGALNATAQAPSPSFSSAPPALTQLFAPEPSEFYMTVS
jgi:hypothetical protein